MAIENDRRPSEAGVIRSYEQQMPGMIRLATPGVVPKTERGPDGNIVNSVDFEDPKIMGALVKAADDRGGWLGRLKGKISEIDIRYVATAGAIIILFGYELGARHGEDFKPIIDKMDKFREKFGKK